LAQVIAVTALPTPGLRNGVLPERIPGLLLADTSGNGLLRGLLGDLLGRHLGCECGLLSHLLGCLLGDLLSRQCGLLGHLLGHLLGCLLGHLLSRQCGLLSHLLGGLLRSLLGYLLGCERGLLGQRLRCLLRCLVSHLLGNFRRLLCCILNRLNRLRRTEELAARSTRIAAILQSAITSATADPEWPTRLSVDINTSNWLGRLTQNVARPSLTPSIWNLIEVA